MSDGDVYLYTCIHHSHFVANLSDYLQYLERKERERGIDMMKQKAK